MATVRPPVLLLLLQLLCLCCLHVWTAGCKPERFGDRCQLQCHCMGNCDVTGHCSGGCSRGYHGPTCQQENVALDKQTNSSSPYESSTSNKAVDGDTRQNAFPNCFHSGVGQNSSWWSVDLDGVFPTNNIVIYYRRETLVRFTGATISTSNATGLEVPCATISNTSQYQNAVVPLNCSHTAQKLIFRQTDHCSGCSDGACINCFLEPCEVQVLVCTNGTYGQNCTEHCGHCSDSASCHHVTGSCLSGSCQPGYRGDRCDQECLNGTHGQDCTEQCGHCSDGARCHHVTGFCLSGSCQPGYRGNRCDQECPKTFYGQNCTEQCGHCSDGANCHHVNGSCLSGSCQPGYRGDRCDQECTNGTYGQDCAKNCSHCSDGANCHPVNGSCLSGSCQPGYRGDRCNEVCTNGNYGQDCSRNCSHCSDGANCHHVNGSCLSGSSQPGYRGDWRDQETNDSPPTETDTSGAVIGGAVAAALVALAVIVLLAVLLLRRRRRGERMEQDMRPEGNVGKREEDRAVYVNVAFGQDSPGSSRSSERPPEEAVATADVIPNVYANMASLSGAADVSSPSCVAVSHLEALVAAKKASRAFKSEYEGVPDSFLADYDISQKEEHAKKNKFRGYYPYDFNRVVLAPTATDPNSHYINASFIDGNNKKGTYIASQAPTPVTLSDFLRMIWQQKCSHVVMLTNLVEDIKVKCVRYWPEVKGEEMKSGEITVTLTQTTEWSYCTLRQLTLNHQDGGSLSVKQFHFTTWPDHGVPSHVDMLDFFWKVQDSWTPDSGPMLVHCSAGVGRTGTFIALCILSDQAASQQRVDPLATLTALRHQRRNMIQTLPQYEFLHEALVRVVQLGRTAMDKEDFCSRFPSERGGLLVGNRTLDQLAQDIPRLCEVTKKSTPSETTAYSNSKEWNYFERSVHISSTAARRGFELVKLMGIGTDVLAPPGLWNFLLGTQACVLLDLHHEQSLVCEGRQQQQQGEGNIRVDWRQPCSLECGLTSRPLTLRSSQAASDVEVEYIALDVSKAEMPGCVATAASRLATVQRTSSSPIVLLYRPSEERCAQLLCAAVNLAESLRLDGHVELVNSLLRLQTPLDPAVVERLAEVAYANLRDVSSVYANG